MSKPFAPNGGAGGQYPKPTIIVLTRAPLPGRCKTRLIPLLGGRGAARVQQALLRRLLDECRQIDARILLAGAPDSRHPALRRAGVPTATQVRGNLGRRMCHHLNAVTAHGSAAVLLGTDGADLSASHIQRALNQLADSADFVLQPSNDGGYVLIGARKPIRGALAGVDWSSGREARQTAAQLRRQGQLSLLPGRCLDVDWPEDYRCARRRDLLPPLPGGQRVTRPTR